MVNRKRAVLSVSLTYEMIDFLEWVRQDSPIPISRSQIVDIALRMMAEKRGYESERAPNRLGA